MVWLGPGWIRTRNLPHSERILYHYATESVVHWEVISFNLLCFIFWTIFLLWFSWLLCNLLKAIAISFTLRYRLRKKQWTNVQSRNKIKQTNCYCLVRRAKTIWRAVEKNSILWLKWLRILGASILFSPMRLYTRDFIFNSIW